ncbi:MAG: metal-sulfur cluster assembly factor [Alphaproteobacteria bacterium]|jgi:metal-sulfur cluster biosynthetic enzyme|nr:metal-sulfur cluster assembly factor [Alphaproteobacteria bacterium]
MTPVDDAHLIDRVRTALKMVIDPELGQNVVDLGMIYEITVTDGCIVAILITTTTRGCPATDFIRQGIEECAWHVDGVELVNVRLTYDPPWLPSMMTPEIAALLGQ